MEIQKHQKIIARTKAWLPVVLWMLVIFTFSSLPTTPSTQIFWQDFIIKKSAHIIEYFALTLLLYRAIRFEGLTVPRILLVTFAISVVYAISDEFHQSFTPGRQATLRDVVIDTVGVSIALLFIYKLNDLVVRFDKMKVVSRYINHE